MLHRLPLSGCGRQNEDKVDELNKNDGRGLAELTLLRTRHAQLSKHSREIFCIVFIVIRGFGFGCILVDAIILGNKTGMVAG